ncbi:DinB family protein [Hymenobacter sp. RP-2-7]|uniref:DinB family protein n=1 Tax=Hymenobacter polaris TaxID=2682546 RepID=A0A7Y0ABV0_9BACT|nr:DinB family protein [Hymenobacter polaris]NML64474.1 DinB family protein [Hymenobacter polaris]
MDIHHQLADLRAFMQATFAALATWFDQPPALLDYVPADQGWSGREILTHVGLTNHYLLILIEKGTAKALHNSRGLELAAELAAQPLNPSRLAPIGLLHAFPWLRPAHMEPRDFPTPLPQVRQQLRNQLVQALACLDRLPDGQGVLYQTTMTVNGLGKLNVYEYLYFLAQHAQRHLLQLAENATEFAALAASEK